MMKKWMNRYALPLIIGALIVMILIVVLSAVQLADALATDEPVMPAFLMFFARSSGPDAQPISQLLTMLFMGAPALVFFGTTLLLVIVCSLFRIKWYRDLIQVLFILIFWHRLVGLMGLDNPWNLWSYRVMTMTHLIPWVAMLYFTHRRENETKRIVLRRGMLSASLCALLLMAAYPLMVWNMAVYGFVAACIFMVSIFVMRWLDSESVQRLIDRSFYRMLIINYVAMSICLVGASVYVRLTRLLLGGF